MLSMDIVSDLHVDYWESNPYDWSANRTSDFVIIAGDVADTIEATLRELRIACQVYKTVMYVHGNHEATAFYGNLRETNERIAYGMRGYSNFVYLCNEDFVLGDTIFVGACGWWDFATPDSENRFDSSWTMVNRPTVIRNVIRSAHNDYEQLKERVHRHPDKRVCIVTHTVPVIDPIIDPNNVFVGQICNSMMREFMNAPNVTHFVFGHHHRPTGIDTEVQGKRLISNPRSRPDDFHRVTYAPLIVDFA